MADEIVRKWATNDENREKSARNAAKMEKVNQISKKRGEMNPK